MRLWEDYQTFSVAKLVSQSIGNSESNSMISAILQLNGVFNPFASCNSTRARKLVDVHAKATATITTKGVQ